MTRENVTHRIVRCPLCKTSYLPEIGEICKCERPDTYDEEPRVVNWEDGTLAKALQHVETKP